MSIVFYPETNGATGSKNQTTEAILRAFVSHNHERLGRLPQYGQVLDQQC